MNDIYISIHFSNAQRYGCTSNMTIKEFRNAKEVPNGEMQVEVWDHKTVEDYRPAKLQLTEEHFSQIELYVNGQESNNPQNQILCV